MSQKLGVGMVAMATAMLAACAVGPARLTAPGEAGTAAVAQAGPRCGRWIVGAGAALAEVRIIVLAGGQGTAEAPRFVGDLVCQLGKRGPVLLALGWPRQLASTLNLALGGSTSAESRLRDDALWSNEGVVAAGLGSRAMWELVAQLRTWRAAGLELKAATFGADLTGPTGEEWSSFDDDDSSERYYQPAALREALRKHPDGTAVLWLDAEQGPSQAKGHAGGTLASRLEEMEFEFTSFLLEEPAAPASATAVPEAGDAGAAAAPWALEPRPELSGYDGVFRLGTTTKSASLRQTGGGAETGSAGTSAP